MLLHPLARLKTSDVFSTRANLFQNCFPFCHSLEDRKGDVQRGKAGSHVSQAELTSSRDDLEHLIPLTASTFPFAGLELQVSILTPGLCSSGFEPKAWHMPGKCSTTALLPSSQRLLMCSHMQQKQMGKQRNGSPPQATLRGQGRRSQNPHLASCLQQSTDQKSLLNI